MDPWSSGAIDDPWDTGWGRDYATSLAPSYDVGWTQNAPPAPFSYNAYFNTGGYEPSFGNQNNMYQSGAGIRWSSTSGNIQAWLAEEAERLGYNNFIQGGGTYTGVGNVGVEWKPGVKLGYFTPDADAEIQAAATKYGVPANFLKAIIHKESSGNWEANSQPVCGIRGMCIDGYVGVFEDAADSWGYNFQASIGNRAYQIDMLAGGLKAMYDRLRQENPEYGWLNVAANHYSGDPTGRYTPPDSYQHGTTQEYMETVQDIWNGLDQDAGNTGLEPQLDPHGLPVNNNLSALDAIWGGAPDAHLTQEQGPTEYSLGKGRKKYEYSVGVLGTYGHPGIDIGMSYGTPIYAATTGTLIRVGGTGSYENVEGDGDPNSGEIRQLLPNGDIVIYGHLSGFANGITRGWDTNQQIQAGTLIGYSGYNAGPHLHLEVRVPTNDPRFSSGMQAIDPRQYFTGQFTGTFQPGPGQVAPGSAPMSYQEMLRAAARGDQIRVEGGGKGLINDWNSWLRVSLGGTEALEGAIGGTRQPDAYITYQGTMYQPRSWQGYSIPGLTSTGGQYLAGQGQLTP